MELTSQPFASKKFAEIDGRRMAYIDEGEGDAIVFSHGNPTSSYLWRNIMPACKGLGRLIACDLIGQGDSEKLPNSGPDRYGYGEQRNYIHALWDHLDLGDRVIFVVHDWGSALAFDWANRNRDRIQGIAYMESIVMAREWSDMREDMRAGFQALRSPAGDDMVLKDNFFVEKILLGTIRRSLTEEEKAEYRRPFLTPGEDRRPTLSWPRQLPMAGDPAEMVGVVEDYSTWLATGDVPKLYFHATPGSLDASPRQVALCRGWKNQIEIQVSGGHYIPEDDPEVVAPAVANFVRLLRGRR